jgi:hypothetical protein
MRKFDGLRMARSNDGQVKSGRGFRRLTDTAAPRFAAPPCALQGHKIVGGGNAP